MANNLQRCRLSDAMAILTQAQAEEVRMTFHILSIDQGTTSTRAIMFNASGVPVSSAQVELKQIYPRSGWVEHDPAEIWHATQTVCVQAVKQAGVTPAAIGITNQRETSVIWDRKTGEPVANAIVWQDRRTSAQCAQLKADGHEAEVAARTGLLLDPYFSATKIAWILDNVPGAREKALRGDLAFGTIDCFLLWHLTEGRTHATDATNAGRTMLFNIHTQVWDPWLLDLFNIPEALLPEVRDCAGPFGETGLFGKNIPVCGMAGDQHAATIGQACFTPGAIKSTYGTGCFIMMNTGKSPASSAHRLLTTIAYRLNGQTTYALEGSIFSAGSAVQWLRDGLGIIKQSGDTEALARSLDHNNGVYLVPAFTGLGAPHWDPEARGAIYGLTRDTGPAELARAVLEAVGYQSRELIAAMSGDAKAHNIVFKAPVIRVDGGMCENSWAMQFLADILDAQVDRPSILETTALGAAWLAGLGAGLYPSLEEAARQRQSDTIFQPAMANKTRQTLIGEWNDAIRRTLTPH